ncbi:MAG: nitrogenase cofactor biosynthesis protein NifB, partial [Rhodospirillales bacterium]|nr:nitrogenase cofactor biosynthesis protein NifB [Rhodospirillales bacterium]
RVKLCLSTNGLALPDHVEAIKALGVDHVTITINAVDPGIGRLIYPWIFHEHRRWTGRDAARILMDRQFKGLDMLVAAGVLVKVNSVMIPGINDEHLKAVNTVVKAHGAFLHNIMPLISDPAHGTHFGVTGQRGPTSDELKALQDGLDGGAKLMKHCRQCRADAVGLLGEDMGADFALDKLEAAETAYDPRPAEIYREVVEADRTDRQNATAMAVARAAATQPGRTLMLAVATKGGGRVNQHFGHAREFQIYEVDAAGPRFVGHRRADHYCQGGFGEDRALDSVLQALRGIDGIVVARIGDCPRDRMEQAGIPVFQDWAYDYIEPALMACRARMTAKSDNALMESA